MRKFRLLIIAALLIFVMISFAYAQPYTYEIQISGTYEIPEGGTAKKWTNWIILDHSLIAFGTENVSDVNVPDEISIDGDLVQDWYIDFDATGEGDRLITFTFNKTTMPYVKRKSLIGYAFRYRVNTNQTFCEPESQFIDSKAGKAIGASATSSP